MNRLSLVLLACTFAAPAFACDGGPLFEMMDAGLPKQVAKTFEVSEVVSTDGGEWNVYFAPDGKTVAISSGTILASPGDGMRGSSSPRLKPMPSPPRTTSTQCRTTWRIRCREEKDIFVFCKGKLLLPPEGGGADPEYEKKAAEALKTFDAPEVAEYVKELKRSALFLSPPELVEGTGRGRRAAG